MQTLFLRGPFSFESAKQWVGLLSDLGWSLEIIYSDGEWTFMATRDSENNGGPGQRKIGDHTLH